MIISCACNHWYSSNCIERKYSLCVHTDATHRLLVAPVSAYYIHTAIRIAYQRRNNNYYPQSLMKFQVSRHHSTDLLPLFHPAPDKWWQSTLKNSSNSFLQGAVGCTIWTHQKVLAPMRSVTITSLVNTNKSKSWQFDWKPSWYPDDWVISLRWIRPKTNFPSKTALFCEIQDFM